MHKLMKFCASVASNLQVCHPQQKTAAVKENHAALWFADYFFNFYLKTSADDEEYKHAGQQRVINIWQPIEGYHILSGEALTAQQ